MDKQIKRALAQHFTPPPPSEKNSFLATLPREGAPYTQVLLAQVAFIRRRIWFGFVACILLALAMTQMATMPERLIANLSALVPLLSLCTISELYRSLAYQMDELELSCRYNLSHILLMRLTILGTANFAVLGLLLLLTGGSGFGLLRNLIYLAVPALLSTNGSLLLLTQLKTRDTLYPCAAVSGGVSLLVLFAQTDTLFSISYVGFWALAFALLVALTAQNLIKLRANMEEYQWNFA